MKQSGQHARYSVSELTHMKRCQFSTLAKDELEAWSGIQINQTRLYEGNKPVRGGPNDLRLGVSSSDQKCETCGETRQCQGHFGYIKLEQAVFHYGYIKFVQKVLKCVCHHCSRLRRYTNPAQKQKFKKVARITHPGKRLNELAKALQNITQCSGKDQGGQQMQHDNNGCGYLNPSKIFIKNYRIYVEEPRTAEQKKQKIKEKSEPKPLYSHIVRNILEGISKQDAKLMGFLISKPIDLMIQSLAVCPPQIRPSIQMNPQKRAEDDITSAYLRIISINKDLRNNTFDKTQKQHKIDEMERIIASIMIKIDQRKIEKGLLSGKQTKAIRSIKSISERLKGKQGRFRQNLMGKRVDFSARSVISPDANIALDELGVPEKVAQQLTVPEEVTQFNYERIKKLCEQGKVRYFLKLSQDRKKYEDVVNLIRSNDRSAQIQKYLNYGIVVQRCLQNGDYVLFNRQPTLHRMSMMGHRVKILPYNTFRLNLSVCTPYNADFDGDQMNMHVPQSFQTIAEIKHIAHVPKQIVAPKNNAPVMGIVQDALLGVYLFTMRDTFLTRQEVMNLVIWIENRQGKNHTEDLLPGQLPMPAILKPQPLWTGKQVMSMIIPDKISIEIRKSSDKNQYLRNIKDVTMIIKKGQLISGALQKEVVGSGAGGLVHSIWLEIGPDATNQFITTAQRIVNNWLTTNSFTVGASDVVPDQELREKINSEAIQINNLYYETLNKYRSEEKIQQENLHQRGKKVFDSFEYYVNTKLNAKLNQQQKIVSEKVSPYLNNIFKMITAKSKGSETNLTQILFLLGNQNVDGKRCPLGFSKRALPHFSKDDNSPESRGFVFSSFFTGLKPHEFFFHSMGGRQGLSDTAVKTSRTGYIQRKLMKSLQDVMVNYDGTVRDSHKNLLQKIYGEDSFTPEYIEKHRFPAVQLSEQDFRNRFQWSEQSFKKFNYKSQEVAKLAGQYKGLFDARNRLRQIFVKGKDNIEIQYYCPIKVERLIDKIRSNKDRKEDVVQPHYVSEQVDKLIDECVPPQVKADYEELLASHDDSSAKTIRQFQKKKKHFEQQNGLQLFRIHLRLFLASKLICESHKLSKNCFNGLIEEIKAKYYQALSVPGQSIGAIAAQSIGEPTTQMTLNTFHLAGVSDKNVTLGVPRLQQLLDASKNIKTPNMTIFLKDKILYKDKNKNDNFTSDITKLVSFEFPERHTRDYLKASRIYYDPNPQDSHIGARIKQLSTERKRTPWVLSLVFDMKKLVFKEPWNEIVFKIERNFDKFFEVTEKVSFHEAQASKELGEVTEQPELTLRCLDLSNQLPNIKKYMHKEKDNDGKEKEPELRYFKFMNMLETQIKDLRISGIKGIKTVKNSRKLQFDVAVSDAIDKKNKENFEFVIFEAQGTNLRACLSHDRIDPVKTYSNDVSEIYNILGIEAARQAFINQFKQIIKPYGIYINYRHLSVLADWMAMRGTITPVNRNGINRVKDVSVLRKASYEETGDIMFNAAVFSELDQLKGVSQRIIFGENVNVGTASFNIMIDRSKVNDFKVKGAVDKKQQYEPKIDMISGIQSGDKTPMIINTPLPFGGRSMREAGLSPAMSIRGGMGMSPSFTPYHHAEFTPQNVYDFDPTRKSPMPVSQTPLLNGMTTPLINAGTSPNYPCMSPNPNSFYNRFSSGNIRNSPHYFMQGSNSPSYSSMRQSQSPQYNSPLSGGQYSNSPVYGQTPINSNREFKEEDNEDDDNDDNDDQ